MAFGPAWYGALKCSLFLFGVPVMISVVTLNLLPPPGSFLTYVGVVVGSIALWGFAILLWLTQQVPSQRWVVATFANTKCPDCGITLGTETVEAARKRFEEKCGEARRNHPGAKINFIRFWSLECPGCGTDLHLHWETFTVTTNLVAQDTGDLPPSRTTPPEK